MKKKISLKEVKVKSFITQLDDQAKQQMVGGAKIPTLERCFTGNYPTINSPCN
ncbi:MAG: pinensin family lanthipeptide [Luteibaculum sp.]